MNAQEKENLNISSFPSVESIIEKRLEEIVTILSTESQSKSALYENVLSMVERILIRIALKRSSNIKTAAALFLGINRNTLHSKMTKLNITDKSK
ncbi:MAG: hypothetical protein M0P57_01030 [Syntrophales bacterium]|nr:hypothetical protein [Syntrophales bacterium]MDY0043429.1 helix-turn-helix domain-containing protein [Syntrophales bacterium]